MVQRYQLFDRVAGSEHLMDTHSALQQVERYQKATSQQERDKILYQIGIGWKLFTVREVTQIAERGGKLSEQQRQRVLGFVEVYFNLDLGRI